MPIQRYRSIEDVPKPERSQRDIASLVESALATRELCGERLSLRGVRLYHDVGEAQKDRARAENERARSLQSQR